MSEPDAGGILPQAVLPPGHHCRTDDLAYRSVGSWYRDHVGLVPVQAAAGLDRYMKTHGATFGEAFAALTGRGGPIILLDEETPQRRPRARA